MSEERTGGTRVNPHEPTRLFEEELCQYTGAKYAVAVNSCTSAILLALAWHIPPRYRYMGKEDRPKVSIPRPGYISVPQSIIHAGGWPVFRDEEWSGCYQLQPFPIWDCARRFTGNMFNDLTASEIKWRDKPNKVGKMQCVSFHASKILGLEQGGAILHDDPQADEWFRRARLMPERLA